VSDGKTHDRVECTQGTVRKPKRSIRISGSRPSPCTLRGPCPWLSLSFSFRISDLASDAMLQLNWLHTRPTVSAPTVSGVLYLELFKMHRPSGRPYTTGTYSYRILQVTCSTVAYRFGVRARGTRTYTCSDLTNRGEAWHGANAAGAIHGASVRVVGHFPEHFPAVLLSLILPCLCALPSFQYV
jgi:hypothetical protein